MFALKDVPLNIRVIGHLLKVSFDFCLLLQYFQKMSVLNARIRNYYTLFWVPTNLLALISKRLWLFDIVLHIWLINLVILLYWLLTYKTWLKFCKKNVKSSKVVLVLQRCFREKKFTKVIFVFPLNVRVNTKGSGHRITFETLYKCIICVEIQWNLSKADTYWTEVFARFREVFTLERFELKSSQI